MSRRLADTPLSEATRERARARRTPDHPAPPPEPGNQRAQRTGAQSNGRNLATFEQTVAEVRQVISEEAPWLRGTDSLALENFCAELTVYRHASAAFAAMSATALTKKHRAQRVNVQRFRALNAMANDLGLTPAGRFKLGLSEARAEAQRARSRVWQPSDISEDRAARVAALLAQQHALPPVSTDEPEAAPPTEEPEADHA